MKFLLLAFLLSCQVGTVFGQLRAIQLPKSQLGDTTRWLRKQEQQIGLGAVEKSPYPFHFRVTSGGFIVEVWQKDTLFQGVLTRWVVDADEALKPIQTTYYQRYELGATQAAAIAQLVKTSGILQLPSDEEIRGWQQGLDGQTIIIQYSDNENYSLKHYWTPSAQNNLAEAILVEQFYNKLAELSNAALVQKAFQADIPFLCYTTHNGSVTCRIARSNSEYWDYKRRASQYRRQVAQKKL